MDLSQLNVLELQVQCQKKRVNKENKELDLFCIELFRRAIVEHDQASWYTLYKIYLPMMMSWIKSDSLPTSVERADIVQAGIMKFSTTYGTERLEKATGLGDILAYLKKCILREFLQLMRKLPRDIKEVELDDEQSEMTVSYDYNAPLAIADIWSIIVDECNDEQELFVADAKLHKEMKPIEMVAKSNGLIQDVDEVNKVWKRLYSRLKRNPKLNHLH